MGFKKMDHNLDFTDLALASSLEVNRRLKRMEKLEATLDWSRVDAVLLQHYTVGTSDEGAKAYPPILLFKACCCNNGFVFPQIPNWRTVLMTDCPSSDFWGCC